MSKITLGSIESQLHESLLDLHEEFLSRGLDCTEEEALELLKAYQEWEIHALELMGC